MKEQQALRMAKNHQLSLNCEQDQKDSNSFDSNDVLQQTGNSFYKRKQSHDGSSSAYREHSEGMQANLNKQKLQKKRKSTDERGSADLSKLKQ